MLITRRHLYQALLLSMLSTPAQAGPDWSAIENARAEKKQQKQLDEKRELKEKGTLERIGLACGRIKGKDEELEALCQEILSSYKDCHGAD